MIIPPNNPYRPPVVNRIPMADLMDDYLAKRITSNKISGTLALIAASVTAAQIYVYSRDMTPNVFVLACALCIFVYVLGFTLWYAASLTTKRKSAGPILALVSASLILILAIIDFVFLINTYNSAPQDSNRVYQIGPMSIVALFIIRPVYILMVFMTMIHNLTLLVRIGLLPLY